MNEDFILGLVIGIFTGFGMLLVLLILAQPFLGKLGDMELGNYKRKKRQIKTDCPGAEYGDGLSKRRRKNE